MLLTDEEIIDLFPDTDDGDGDIQYGRAIEAAVLAKLREQEPVAWADETGYVWPNDDKHIKSNMPLFLHPAPIPEGWISVDDRLPESDEEVLVFPPPSDYCITASYGYVAKAGHQKAWEWGEYETGYGHVNHKYQPTHWMPLPQPPMAAVRSGE